jgi:hypothetical protein
MKKVVRMLGLCALVALAFTACKKNNTQKVSFTATMPQATTESRTHVQGLNNDYFLVWDEGDQIKVFNEAGDSRDFTLTTKADETATFTVEDADKINFLADLESADYTAFYPNAVINGEKVELTIPAIQNYNALHNFDNNTYPMYALNGGTNFDFTSNCGFLYLLFQAPEGQVKQFDKVVVTANDPTDYLNGTLSYDKDGGTYQFIGGTNVVSVTSASKLSVLNDLLRDVTIILPEGALWSGFTVEVYDGENCIFTKSAQPQANMIQAKHFTEMMSQVIE